MTLTELTDCLAGLKDLGLPEEHPEYDNLFEAIAECLDNKFTVSQLLVRRVMPKKKPGAGAEPNDSKLVAEAILGHMRQLDAESFSHGDLKRATGYSSRAVTLALTRLERRTEPNKSVFSEGKGRGKRYWLRIGEPPTDCGPVGDAT